MGLKKGAKMLEKIKEQPRANTNPLFDELANKNGKLENIACYVLLICKLREHKKNFAKLIFFLIFSNLLFLKIFAIISQAHITAKVF